jgi:hypothetical protein
MVHVVMPSNDGEELARMPVQNDQALKISFLTGHDLELEKVRKEYPKLKLFLFL